MGSGGDGDGGPPTVTFGYTPANFDPAGLDRSGFAASATVLDCGVSTFDSETLTFGNWCGQKQPAPAVRTQPNGPDVVVIPLPAFTVAKGATLKLTGTRPVILAVFGDAIVDGTVDASASGATPGAGGNQSCGTSQGGNGSGDPSRNDGASGGGGGGFETAGGDGGLANTDGCCGGSAMRNVPGGTGGAARGATGQSPLLGGCAGGQAGGCSMPGGAGGGAVQISASSRLSLTGTVRADGGDGATPCGSSDEGGGTGGGSGGGILLEGATLEVSVGALEANGGSGGTDGDYFHCGGNAGASGSTNASRAGSNGQDCVGGSPGGGGGYGRVQTLDR
jgi:hypothetical protein